MFLFNSSFDDIIVRGPFKIQSTEGITTEMESVKICYDSYGMQFRSLDARTVLISTVQFQGWVAKLE